MIRGFWSLNNMRVSHRVHYRRLNVFKQVSEKILNSVPLGFRHSQLGEQGNPHTCSNARPYVTRSPEGDGPALSRPFPRVYLPSSSNVSLPLGHVLTLGYIYLSAEFSHTIELKTYVVIGSGNLRRGIARAIFVRSTDQMQPPDVQTEGFSGVSISPGE